MAVNLSAAQLLSFLRCPRRFWLEQYHPEHEGDVAAMDAFLDAEAAASAAAREAFRDDAAAEISGRLGLRRAIEQTTEALAHGRVLFDATFEYEGVSAQVDILDWSSAPYRAISVTAASAVTARHINDCALQSWAMKGLGLPEHRFCVALTSAEAAAGARFDSLFETVDVTPDIQSVSDRLDTIVADARSRHAELEMPDAQTGAHCRVDYDCPFLEYCERL